MEKIEKLRKAWKNAPTGAIARVYRNHTPQNVRDVLKNGRKDESIIDELLEAIKKASAEVAKEICDNNKKVQEL